MRFASFMTDDASEVSLGPYLNDAAFRDYIFSEVVKERVYERFLKVRPGDVVVDIGANIGLFPYTLKYSNPSRVICVEPSIALIPTLVENTRNLGFRVDILNCGIGKQSEDSLPVNPKTDYIYFKDSSEQTFWKTMTLQDILGGTKANFLKIDCEGYEYDVFTNKNYEFIRNNVEYIAAEFHLGPLIENSVERFKEFRRTYLKGDNFKIFEPYHTPPETFSHQSKKHNISFFWKDVTEQCVKDLDYPRKLSEYWTDHAQLMIYINNR